jgi:hypothetical protein
VLISWSHSSPEGGVGAFVGRQGGTKPAGRERDNMALILGMGRGRVKWGLQFRRPLVGCVHALRPRGDIGRGEGAVSEELGRMERVAKLEEVP